MKNVFLLLKSRRAFGIFMVLLISFALYAARVLETTPGFYLDEAAIAYNALHIARHGTDENGVAFPLYPLFYRDFSYATIANPAYIYGLAAIFFVLPPSILAARMFSVALGFGTAILLGILARRIYFDFVRRQNTASENSQVENSDQETDSPILANQRAADFVGFIAFFATLATPWLYEISRLVFEVALFPFALALFLMLLHRAQQAARNSDNGAWPLSHSIYLALSLGLLTYSYSIGRLLAPLLALGLAFFATRGNWRGVLSSWAFFALTLIPYAIYTKNHPGSLTARFYVLSYITPQSTFASALPEFLQHFFANANPWTLLAVGDGNLRHHLPKFGAFLVGFYALCLLGFFLALRKPQRSAWWTFILYGAFCALLPVSLTRNDFHALQMIAFPVFLLIPLALAVSWLLPQTRKFPILPTKHKKQKKQVAAPTMRTRIESSPKKIAVLSVLLFAATAQFVWFQTRFQREAPFRGYAFDDDFPRVFQIALNSPQRPIYLEDGDFPPAYIYAYWHGATLGIGRREFVHLPRHEKAPRGALVVSSVKTCSGCTVLAESAQFKTYIAP